MPDRPDRPGQFIQIIEDAEFTFSPKHPDSGEPLGSTLRLRVVPDDVQEVFRKRHTKVEWRRGQRLELLANGPFLDDCLDYAIVDWTDVYAVRLAADGSVTTRASLPCTRANKERLPEPVKIELVRLCIGKEYDRVVAAEDDDSEPMSGPPKPAAVDTKNG